MSAKTVNKLVMTALKHVKFRAKVSRMGDKVHIIVPKAYHKDIDALVDEFVDVEVVETRSD